MNITSWFFIWTPWTPPAGPRLKRPARLCCRGCSFDSRRFFWWLGPRLYLLIFRWWGRSLSSSRNPQFFEYFLVSCCWSLANFEKGRRWWMRQRLWGGLFSRFLPRVWGRCGIPWVWGSWCVRNARNRAWMQWGVLFDEGFYVFHCHLFLVLSLQSAQLDCDRLGK